MNSYFSDSSAEKSLRDIDKVEDVVIVASNIRVAVKNEVPGAWRRQITKAFIPYRILFG
jgi:hypothetical protein